MAHQSVKSSKNAAPGDFNPKKMADHKTFRISWTAKTAITFCFCHEPDQKRSETEFQILRLAGIKAFLTTYCLDQTKYKEIPIRKNKIIQTGPKIQFGGLNDGFARSLYQVSIAGAVKTEPIAPASSQIAMLIISLAIFFIFLRIPS